MGLRCTISDMVHARPLYSFIFMSGTFFLMHYSFIFVFLSLLLSFTLTPSLTCSLSLILLSVTPYLFNVMLKSQHEIQQLCYGINLSVISLYILFLPFLSLFFKVFWWRRERIYTCVYVNGRNGVSHTLSGVGIAEK